MTCAARETSRVSDPAMIRTAVFTILFSCDLRDVGAFRRRLPEFFLNPPIVWLLAQVSTNFNGRPMSSTLRPVPQGAATFRLGVDVVIRRANQPRAKSPLLRFEKGLDRLQSASPVAPGSQERQPNHSRTQFARTPLPA